MRGTVEVVGKKGSSGWGESMREILRVRVRRDGDVRATGAGGDAADGSTTTGAWGAHRRRGGNARWGRGGVTSKECGSSRWRASAGARSRDAVVEKTRVPRGRRGRRESSRRGRGRGRGRGRACARGRPAAGAIGAGNAEAAAGRDARARVATAGGGRPRAARAAARSVAIGARARWECRARDRDPTSWGVRTPADARSRQRKNFDQRRVPAFGGSHFPPPPTRDAVRRPPWPSGA